jgi:CheY-like chemotaxis protein
MTIEHNGLLRVLVVDDGPDDTLAFGALLKHLGCNVETSNDPHQCEVIADRFNPHLIFLDVAMPGQSGIDVVAQLRAAHDGNCLVIARTGFTDEKTKKRCLDAGFNLVLIKPVELSSLERLLDTARKVHGHEVRSNSSATPAEARSSAR